MNKKVLITILITIILLIFSIILYPIIKNNNYQKKLLNNIYENTNLKDIKYLNKDNNYYIIKTKDKVLVLDLNYEEVYSISANEIKKSDLDLSYTRNNLYYKERIRKNNKLTYKYYDIKTNEEVFTSVLTIEEYQEALLNKLQEETNEVKNARTKKEILEELADVLEVLDAISCSQGSDLTEVTRIKEEKRAKKGGFSKRIYLHKTITK